MGKIYKIGSRTSSLALRQVDEILARLITFYPDFKAKVVGIKTYGDRDQKTPISEIEGTDFFTREVDQYLVDKKIDFAIHSAKDLPDQLKKGVKVAALTESIEPRDVLVAKNNLKLGELPYGAVIGTSSKRRKVQLKNYRKDFKIVDIRGNIPKRLKILKDKNSRLDAIVIAAAGLIRLGSQDEISQKLPFEIMQPHSLQGSLAITIRKEDVKLNRILNILDKNYLQEK
ncbi:MAG: hydroxymethylbilane synthase [Candidatus Omnitrophica bacterium]|nr:hydroxymethylbilane synthase [Candidatus Omnitrophota bacterium]